ncbi:hypothetical protein [Streptomyces xiamenensis]|uniref:hypothetical protein n=1 Tax=Streptomyces xiamenensis TaxID=408015 RepID=UPI0037D8824F
MATGPDVPAGGVAALAAGGSGGRLVVPVAGVCFASPTPAGGLAGGGGAWGAGAPAPGGIAVPAAGVPVGVPGTGVPVGVPAAGVPVGVPDAGVGCWTGGAGAQGPGCPYGGVPYGS